MPNTLLHLGLQSFLARPLARPGDFRWVLLGAVVPDLPWILQRIVRELPSLDLLDIRLYCAIQSSLVVSAVASAALACLARRPGRAFGLLLAGCLVHLLLDGLQYKWGNGVLLFAPLSWELSDFAVLWPEHPLSTALTLLAPVWLIFCWRGEERVSFHHAGGRRIALAVVFAVAYAGLPCLWMDPARSADLHAVSTLSDRSLRTGKALAVDRGRYEALGEGSGRIHHWSGETLRVTSGAPAESGTLSMRGRFVGEDRIALDEVHRHTPYLRQLASILGLAFVLWVWLPREYISRAEEKTRRR